ncbi:hypothetical protein VNI00_006856 [Paramarasmius palmivorus]|uniref:Peptidase A1 domain-containing protein n=1 Tax=Paramarasmius palmivorus TaxID=297713 RepID=A0AAW0D8X0_9AGAR
MITHTFISLSLTLLAGSVPLSQRSFNPSDPSLDVPPTISFLNSSSSSPGSFSLPIRRHTPTHHLARRQGSVSGSTGLGNNNDLLYTIPITFGNQVTAVHLDTGSSDLWAITSQCTTGTCSRLSTLTHPINTPTNVTNTKVDMRYGDSLTGTSAQGLVAFDTATVAGIAITNQPFAAVSATTNTVVQFGASGIFGLSFPSGSDVQEQLTIATSGQLTTTDAFIKNTWKYGPLTLPDKHDQPTRIADRGTIDAGTGGEGKLTVGKLPDEVEEGEVDWVPVRLYKPEEGGLRAPGFAPDEVYPFRWELDIDGVYLDGKRLPDSTIPPTGGVDAKRVSALIDTGNSLMRGPKDVVDNILSQVSPNYRPGVDNSATFPCETVHRLEFEIGGKRYPIDPRDFIGPLPNAPNDATTCVADNLVETDAPGIGALFRWSLGDPFFKSNLVAFHYGNLTHPSVDPPRIGLRSLVPPDADEQLRKAVAEARASGVGLDNSIELAPTASAATAAQITVSEVPLTSTSTFGASPTDANNGQATQTQATETPVVTISMDGPNGGSTQEQGSRDRILTSIRIVAVQMAGLSLSTQPITSGTQQPSEF